MSLGVRFAVLLVLVVTSVPGATADSTGTDLKSSSAGMTDPVDPSATRRADPAASDPFPQFESIRGNVRFWKQVFANWKLSQIAVHDLQYPAVVYEVVDLPGPAEERYTDEQKDFIEEVNERWEQRLLDAEQKVSREEPLSPDEQAWVALLTKHAGSEALVAAHERVRTQRGLRERFRRGVEISRRYDASIRRIFREAGLPEDLAYLPHVESSFQAAARSSAGAVGVWQFTRGTGKRYMTINGSVDERLDPIAAARGAAAYLADAYERLEDWAIALTSYNHGVVGMRRAVERHGLDYETIFREYDGRRFGFASRNFYSEFLAAMEIARDPEQHFPEGLQPESPLRRDSIVLEQRTTPARLAGAYKVPLERLAEVNPAWSRRAVRADHALPRNLHVWLPEGTLDRISAEGHTPDYAVSGWIDIAGHYVVQPGDSLSVIAATYGVKLSTLREINGIPAGRSLIRTGQKLKLGSTARERTHVVKRGETLSRIAQLYHMSLDRLRQLNGLAPNESLIRVGQMLRVSGMIEAAVHIVRRGENLIRIALSYEVRLSDLLRANRLSMTSTIHPGQALQIPIPR